MYLVYCMQIPHEGPVKVTKRFLLNAAIATTVLKFLRETFIPEQKAHGMKLRIPTRGIEPRAIA